MLTIKSSRVRFVFAALVFAGVFSTSSAFASTVFFDRAAWQAAVGSFTNIDFSGITADGTISTFNNASGLTVSGVNFVGKQNETTLIGGSQSFFQLVVADDTAPGPYNWGAPAVVGGIFDLLQLSSPAGSASENGSYTATLPAGINAIGIDLMGVGSVANNPVDVTLSTGEMQIVDTAGQPNRVFIGFISDVPISSVSLSPEGPSGFSFGFSNETLFTNFSFATVSSVPEPSTAGLTILAGGMLFAFGLARRRSVVPRRDRSSVI
jgi:hypothetical protein